MLLGFGFCSRWRKKLNRGWLTWRSSKPGPRWLCSTRPSSGGTLWRPLVWGLCAALREKTAECRPTLHYPLNLSGAFRVFANPPPARTTGRWPDPKGIHQDRKQKRFGMTNAKTLNKIHHGGFSSLQSARCGIAVINVEAGLLGDNVDSWPGGNASQPNKIIPKEGHHTRFSSWPGQNFTQG